jgi:hypothetical protein
MKLNLGDGSLFEQEVRNVARQLWASDHYSGPVTVDNKERDGIFVTEEAIHYVEATISRAAGKVEKDLQKIKTLTEQLRRRHPDKAVKGWFITRDEPTGEQGAKIVNFHGIATHQTYHQFYGRLIDSLVYIGARKKHPFGSARNVSDNSLEIGDNEYVQTNLIVDDFPANNVHSPVSVHNFIKDVANNSRRSIITGEYGVGKSMFLRHVFFDLSDRHRKGADNCSPIYINLVDHVEQYDPAECLIRHGKKLGFPKPEHLVRAWKAGYSYIILDGFDELTPRIATKDVKRAKDLRRGALELVKRFVRETPNRSSVVIAGRSNFFDNRSDLRGAVGANDLWPMYKIVDFNELQTAEYLKKRHYVGGLPNWIFKF